MVLHVTSNDIYIRIALFKSLGSRLLVTVRQAAYPIGGLMYIPNSVILFHLVQLCLNMILNIYWPCARSMYNWLHTVIHHYMICARKMAYLVKLVWIQTHQVLSGANFSTNVIQALC